jgi:hypothetical protein
LKNSEELPAAIPGWKLAGTTQKNQKKSKKIKKKKGLEYSCVIGTKVMV